ncbi:MAG: DUF4836 family protein [Ferruginibacter sp.]
MQTRFKFFLFLSVCAILFLSSCSKTNKEGRYIPENAAFVVHLNGKSLNSKLPWEEIKQSELFKGAYADTATPAIVRSVMDNPENTGIDVKNDLLIFVIKDSSGGYVSVEGTVKDAAKFKQFNNSVNKTPATETEKDGIHYLSSDKMTASWKEEKFVMVMDAPGLNNMNNMGKMGRNYDDSTTTATPGIKKDLNAIAAQIFALKEDNSLGKEEKFTELMKESGDIHFWVNIEALGMGSSDMPGMAALSMINFKKIYEGSRATGTINFENGKINADFTSYSGKEMTDLVKKYSGDKINSDMLKRIPSKNVAGLFALNFKPEGIREYLKLLGVEGFANMGTAFLGFNLDDFIKANKGDILLSVTDFTQDSSGRPDFSVIFSTSIGDKPSFGKLIEAGKKLAKDKLNGENGPSIAYNMNENYFAIGNKKQDVDKYITTANNSSLDFLDKISGNSSAAYINFQYLLKAMSREAQKDSLGALIYDASVKMWDNLIFTGTGFKNGGSTSHLEINLLDKNTNSLKQLNNYLGILGVIKKKHDEQKKNAVVDGFEPATADTSATLSTH